MQGVRGDAAMTAALASEGRVRPALAGLEERLSIAALNAPENVVISGYSDAIVEAERRLREKGVEIRRLAVSHGFHSPQMEEMEAAFEETVRSVAFQTPKIELISSLTGRPASAAELSDPGYWRRQVRRPVQFQAAMETLGAKGIRVFLEIGPGSTLAGLGRQTLPGEDLLWSPSLRQARGEWQQMLESLGKLWTRGAEVNWAEFDAPYARRRIAVPTYPFERQRYWVETGVRRPGRAPLQAGQTLAVAAAALSARAGELRREHGYDAYDNLRAELDALCADYIVGALRALGFDFREGERVSEEDLFARSSVAGRYRALFGRLIDILAEDGILAREDGAVAVKRRPGTAQPEARIEALRAKFPAYWAELALTARCAGSLGAVLKGEADPLHLLFPDGSAETVEAIYSQSPGTLVFNRVAAEATASEAARAPRMPASKKRTSAKHSIRVAQGRIAAL
jgi:acyl transferase domain-containing protein